MWVARPTPRLSDSSGLGEAWGPHFENHCSTQSGGIKLYLSWSWKLLSCCLDRISHPKLWVQNKIQ